MNRIITEKDLLTIKEASEWASGYLGKNVTNSNISYLVQENLHPNSQMLKEVNYENIHSRLSTFLCSND